MVKGVIANQRFIFRRPVLRLATVFYDIGIPLGLEKYFVQLLSHLLSAPYKDYFDVRKDNISSYWNWILNVE